MSNKALLGALKAASKGIKVLPVKSLVKEEKGEKVWLKTPAIREWPLKATTDVETIKNWGETFSHFGGTTEGLIAFDTDSVEALASLKELFKSAGLGSVTPTFAVATARGGYHIYYKQPEGYELGNSVSKIAPKLDTRGGAGGYLVLPGSINPVNGKGYCTSSDIDIATLPVEVAEKIKPLIKRAKKVKDYADGSMASRVSGSQPDTPRKIKAATDFLNDCEGGVQGQGGNDDAYSVGTALGDIGLSYKKALELMAAIYSPKCCPPWETKELAVVVKNSYVYRDSDLGDKDPDLTIDMFDAVDSESLTEEDLGIMKFKSFAEFRGMPVPPRESLIKDFMAHGRYITFIYGRGGSGKSLLNKQLIRQLSKNQSFLGMELGTMQGRIKAALVSMEEPEEDVHARYVYMSEKIDPDNTGDEPLWINLRGKRVDFVKKDRTKGLIAGPGLESLVKAIKFYGINLLVIDSLAKMFLANENDRADVTQFSYILDELTEKTNCHIIMLAHTNKAGAFSGSSAWEAICRQMFVISAKKFGKEYIYTLTLEKSNEGKLGAYVRYRWDSWFYAPVSDEEYEALLNGESDEDSRVHQEQLDTATEAILEYLASGEKRSQQIKDEIRSSLRIKFPITEEALDDLVGDGSIVLELKTHCRNKDTKFYSLT